MIILPLLFFSLAISGYCIYLIRQLVVVAQQKQELESKMQIPSHTETQTPSFSTPEPVKVQQHLSDQILANLNYGIVALASDHTVQFVNAYATHFLNTPNPIGQSYQKVFNISDENSATNFSLFEDALLGNSHELPTTFSLTTPQKKVPINGSLIPFSVNNHTMVLFVFQDNSFNIEKISEDKAFFSAASHELRTPLTVIRFAVSLLLTKLDTLEKEKIIEYLKKIDRTSQHLLNLVNDFLNISRLETGRLIVEKKAFDIVVLTGEVVKELSDLAHDKKLYVHHVPDTTQRMVVGDKTKAKEVLINLVSNAIKYTIYGGITITHSLYKTSLETSVTDTGTGISTEYQRLLFQKFSQIGSARTQTTSKSTGLGLYVSKKIAMLMQGDVLLKSSEPGRGSTFIFRLPIG